jgi:hypothetical protein
MFLKQADGSLINAMPTTVESEPADNRSKAFGVAAQHDRVELVEHALN